MDIKQKKPKIIIGLIILAISFVFALPSYQSAFAADTTTSCGGVDTAILSCGGSKDATEIEDTGIWSLLIIAINVFTGGVGVAALAGIVYGAVTYTSAGGSPEKVKKAMNIFTNVVIGVVAYALMFSLLNFIIPGGLFT